MGLQETQLQNDEEAVIALVSLTESWVNPFAISNNPMSISIARAFSNLNKKKEIRSRSVIRQADRAISSRIIVMAQNHNLHMAEVLSDPLGPLP